MIKKLLFVLLGTLLLPLGVSAQNVGWLLAPTQSSYINNSRLCDEGTKKFFEDGILTMQEFNLLYEEKCFPCLLKGDNDCKDKIVEYIKEHGKITKETFYELLKKCCWDTHDQDPRDPPKTDCRELFKKLSEDGKLTKEEIEELRKNWCLDCLFKKPECKELFFQLLNNDWVIDSQELATLKDKWCLECENDNWWNPGGGDEPQNTCEKYIVAYFQDGFLSPWEFLALKKRGCLCKLSYERLQELLKNMHKWWNREARIREGGRTVGAGQHIPQAVACADCGNEGPEADRPHPSPFRTSVLPPQKVQTIKEKLSKLSIKKRETLKLKLQKALPTLKRKDPQKALIVQDILNILEMLD